MTFAVDSLVPPRKPFPGASGLDLKSWRIGWTCYPLIGFEAKLFFIV